jgi:cysteinyl-tRNA synthetase, unknown class
MLRQGVAVGAGGISHMAAARALAVSGGKSAALQRPASSPPRPSMRMYRRAPPGYQFALPLYRPTRRSAASWLVGACLFGLKLVASGLAGVMLAMALWQDGGKLVPAPEPAGQQTGAYSSSGETTIYRRGPTQGGADRGWDGESTDPWWHRALPSNYPRRVKTTTFTPPAPEATGAIPSQGATSRSVALPSARPPQVRNWRYQLQNINPAEIASSSHDLVVIDYSGEDGPFSPAQVERMKQKPDGSRRLVLSYMSIGEAETYRWYWSQRSSSWLGPENKKWRGNYGVKFWDPAWQEIIFAYTDRILAAGFDGVYLDKVDEFEEMGHRDDMVEFVSRIATRAKSQRPGFLVVSQNGDDLLPNVKFRAAIDGFAREDLFYGEDSDGKRNSASSIRESVKRLKMFSAEGKPVFVVEYPRNDSQAHTARREIAEQGFIGLMARRALNTL